MVLLSGSVRVETSPKGVVSTTDRVTQGVCAGKGAIVPVIGKSSCVAQGISNGDNAAALSSKVAGIR